METTRSLACSKSESEWSSTNDCSEDDDDDDDLSRLECMTNILSDDVQCDSVLRGTSLAALLGLCGSELRSSPDKLACDAALADRTYEKSFKVKCWDIFISHSWQAPWFRKYLTLLFHFNSVGAVTVAILSCMLYVTIAYFSATPQVERDLGLSGRRRLGQLVVKVTIMLITLLTLFFGQYIAAFVKVVARTVFFDKVCIHQADADLKAKGIASIGGIIARSKTLLVAWDSSYFTRLWCPYEIASFKYCNPAGSVVILPVESGALAALLSAVGLLEAVGIAVLHCFYMSPTNNLFSRIPFYAFLGLPFAMYAFLQKKNLQCLQRMKEELASYSVRNAESFCCTHNHIHPDTSERLPCDRALVLHAISHWHGSGDQSVGTDAFSKMVRSMCKSAIDNKLGRCGLPYRFALLVGVWHFIVATIASYYRVEHKYHGLNAHSAVWAMLPFDVLFLSDPLMAALMFWGSGILNDGKTRTIWISCMRFVAIWLFALSIEVLLWELFYVFVREGLPTYYVLQLFVKAFLVYFLYT